MLLNEDGFRCADIHKTYNHSTSVLTCTATNFIQIGQKM